MIYFNGIHGKNYFEGWFFRLSCDNFRCALIPSIAVADGEKKAFIQINCPDFSKKTEYPYADFFADENEIAVGENRFSADGIRFSSPELTLDARFGPFFSPEKDIMGCFRFGTPCKHKLVSMRHAVSGTARLGGKAKTDLLNGVGYAEKDWGKSFPKAYCWLQCNEFGGEDASFFCSVADIGLPFRGLICVLMLKDEEYRFATYNFARIEKLHHGEITLKKGDYRLQIDFCEGAGHSMAAPTRGRMDGVIKEDLNGTVRLRLSKKEAPVCDLTGRNAGIEWVDRILR